MKGQAISEGEHRDATENQGNGGTRSRGGSEVSDPQPRGPASALCVSERERYALRMGGFRLEWGKGGAYRGKGGSRL